MSLQDNFSIVYHEFLKDFFQLEVPKEEWIDCNNCFYCSNKSLVRANTKCCDYQPAVPNFVVGSILNDSTSETSVGKKIIQNQIKNKLGVTPHGIMPSSSYNQLLKRAREKGRTVSQQEITAIKCAFYHEGGCSIYKHKSDICGHHHCHSISTDSGETFWEHMKKFNLFIDKKFSLAVAEMMGIPYPTEIKTLKQLTGLTETSNGKVDDAKYKALWGNWYNREADYYKNCHLTFTSLTTDDLESILGEELEKGKSELKNLAIQFRKDRTPEYLKFRNYARLDKSTEKLSKTEVMFLKLFDGKNKTSDVVKKAAHFQIQLGKTIKRLLKEGVLVEH